MLASEILRRASTLLNDDDHVRWPVAQLFDWLNEAIRAILMAKPSAHTETVLITLVTGTKQSLPANVHLLVNIERNFLTSAGRVVSIIDRRLLDEEEPNWHNPAYIAQSPEVRHYVYSEATPRLFYVYPGNTGTGIVEATVATMPPLIAPTNQGLTLADYAQEIGLPEPYSVPLLDYVMYRSFLVDDLAGQVTKGGAHFQQFMAAVGLKIQVEGATSPNMKRQQQ